MLNIVNFRYLFVFVWTFYTPTVIGTCSEHEVPPQYKLKNGKYYRPYVTIERIYRSALVQCENQGALLAMPKNSNDLESLKYYLNQTTYSYLWIGLSDWHRSTCKTSSECAAGNLTWNDGTVAVESELDTFDWMSSTLEGVSQCIIVDPESHKIAKGGCSVKYSYVCQYECKQQSCPGLANITISSNLALRSFEGNSDAGSIARYGLLG